jgi:subtilisin family serine protease
MRRVEIYLIVTLSLAAVIFVTLAYFYFKTTAKTNFVNDELIVKLKTSKHEKLFKSSIKKYNASFMRTKSKHPIGKIKIPKGANISDIMSELKKDAQIEYVEPNYIYTIDLVPNDPKYQLQWGLPRMKVDKAWNVSTNSSPITIAVVDTGVDSDHPDLVGDLVSGYNIISNNTNTDDDNGHGTHVAGIAAGVMENSKGIAGIAGHSRIMPVKVIGSNGSGTTLNIAEGVRWAVDHGAKVINLSLGGPDYSQTLQSAVEYARSKGALVVAAAGNSNTYIPSYPAAMNHVISVAAIDKNNTKASFSNYGSSIDLCAPGTAIFSTMYDGYYGYMQGTSMACPNVTGVIALIWSQNSKITPNQIEYILEARAQDLGAKGKDIYYGYGLVDAYASMMAVKATK